MVESDAEVIVDHDYPRVPDGEYQAVFVGHDVVEMHQFKGNGKPQAKLFMRFKLFDAGEHSGKGLVHGFPGAPTNYG